MENNKYQENISVEELSERELSWFKGEIVLIEDITTFRKVFPQVAG